MLERLAREAQEAGGRLYLLNGNHETMNVMGDHRYATTGKAHAARRIAAEGGKDSSVRQTELWHLYWWSRLPRKLKLTHKFEVLGSVIRDIRASHHPGSPRVCLPACLARLQARIWRYWAFRHGGTSVPS